MMSPNALGTGLAFLYRALNEVSPVGLRVGHEGESRRFVQETIGFGVIFAVSLLFICLVLSAQFSGSRDPLVAVPLSIFGALVPLALDGGTQNLYTDGTADADRTNPQARDIDRGLREQQGPRRGMDRKQSAQEGAASRLRPILMTTCATVLGVLPLLLAFGAGANDHFAIGLVITSGILVDTLFTRFVLPSSCLPFGRSRTTEPPARPMRNS